MTVNHRGHWQTPAYGVITGKTCTRVSTSGSTCVYRDLWHLATELKLKKTGKRENEIRRTVTWERDALHVHVNGFHERVQHSSRYPLICLTRNRIWWEMPSFPRQLS